MPESAQVIFNELDQSFSVGSLLQGIAAVSLQTLRGQYGARDEIFTSWAAFKAHYGGELTTSDGPTLAKRALERGAMLRVNKVGHYDDVADVTSLTALKGEFTFGLGLKTAGAGTAQVDTITLTGTSGTANVTINGMTRLATYATSLTVTAAAFVTSWAADYLTRGIVITDSTGDIICTASLAGQLFPAPTIVNVTTDLAGTIVQTIPNNENGERYFYLTLKYAGADYNNLSAVISAASNGSTNFFDLDIVHANDGSIAESFTNLTIIGTPDVGASTYLDLVKTGSALVDVNYQDASGFVGPLRPDNGTYACLYGIDGATVVATDYNGDSAGGTGNFAFDSYDDFEAIGILDDESASTQIALSAYTDNRGDCVAFLHLANSNNSVATLQSARAAITTDTRFMYISSGGLTIDDPFLAGAQKEISELGDEIGTAMRSSAEFGPWWSFAGPNRGRITNALGVVNNFVIVADLNLLAQRQINTVKQANGQILVTGNFSGQLLSSRKSFINVVKLLIYIRKSLRPILEASLEEPNDFPTFKKIYGEVEPFLTDLAGTDKRALVEYAWRGDQFATKDSELKINTRSNLDAGEYKVELYLKEIVSLQKMTISIISAPSGISFELI